MVNLGTSLSLVAAQELNEQEFDSFVIVANNLANDLRQANLLEQFGDLQLLKEVNLIWLVCLFVLNDSYFFYS